MHARWRRDADIADDLVQDTLCGAAFGAAVSRRRRRSWLYTILTNLNKNRRRSLARRPQFMPLPRTTIPMPAATEAEAATSPRAGDTGRGAAPRCCFW